MTWNIHVGDVLEWAARYDGPPFHALLCDPPYELAFMNKGWDNTGIAFRPETWAALAQHLHPGGFGMAFASSRGWHRMAVAIEDAGLVFHPTIFVLGWVAGSGFPKATRIRDNGQDVPGWDTHRYGLQALKPALEPIIVFQKPYAGRPVDSITQTGAGAWNVKGGRIGTEDNLNGGSYGNTTRENDEFFSGKRPGGAGVFAQPPGRWPAHLALAHTPACTPDACADACAVKALGEMSGESVCKPGSRGSAEIFLGNGKLAHSPETTLNDSGTAARYFFNADYLLERMAGEPPFFYAAKADRWEREAGLENAPEYSGEELSGGGHSHDYQTAYQAKKTARRNPHPTVKPIALIHWLSTLLLPPDAYAPRRLLVPFAGSGSEMIGATLAGWEDVQGIEQSTEYAAVAWQRLAFWQQFVGAEGWDAAQERARAFVQAQDDREAQEAAGQLGLWDAA